MLAHAGEIGIKSKTTRRFMIKRLYKNISIKFPNFNLHYKNIANRTIIYTNQPVFLAQKIADIIFGVSHTAPIFIFKWTSYEHLLDSFTGFASQFISPSKSFGFEARSSGKNRPHTQELKVELGSKLYEAFNGSLTVNLTDPDFLFVVEVRDEFAWIYHERIQGLDGFPQGSQKGIIFGSIRFWLNDYSATFLTMKRGVNVHPIRFITQRIPESAEETWHESFLNNFSFKKCLDIPIYDLLQSWQPVYGDNLCTACMYFTENLLTTACKLRNVVGFVSGLKIASLQGDITNNSLKWLESQNIVFKIRPNLIATHEISQLNKIFDNFPSKPSCCPFQSKRFIKSTLSSDEAKIIDEKVHEFVDKFFIPNYPDNNSMNDKLSEK